MRDTWGPPATDDGWPSFDENGRRIRPPKSVIDRAFGLTDGATSDRGVAEVVRLLNPAPDDLEFAYAELGGET